MLTNQNQSRKYIMNLDMFSSLGNRRLGNSEDVNSIDARELHGKLGIRSDFSTWLKVQIKFFDENEDFIMVPLEMDHNNCPKTHGGHNKIDYILTIDTAKHIALMSRTAKGREIRKYFIHMEKLARDPMGNILKNIKDSELEKEKDPSGYGSLNKNGDPRLKFYNSSWRGSKNSKISNQIKEINKLEKAKEEAVKKLNGLFDADILEAIKEIEASRVEAISLIEEGK